MLRRCRSERFGAQRRQWPAASSEPGPVASKDGWPAASNATVSAACPPTESPADPAGFQAAFPGAPQPRVFRAPGRVNLIGEHTDYNLGFGCPMALDLARFVAAAPNTHGALRVNSEDRGQLREWPVEDLTKSAPAGDWADYSKPIGRVKLLGNNGPLPFERQANGLVVTLPETASLLCSRIRAEPGRYEKKWGLTNSPG